MAIKRLINLASGLVLLCLSAGPCVAQTSSTPTGRVTVFAAASLASAFKAAATEFEKTAGIL